MYAHVRLLGTRFLDSFTHQRDNTRLKNFESRAR